MEFKHNAFTTVVCTFAAVSTVVLSTSFATKQIHHLAVHSSPQAVTTSSTFVRSIPIQARPSAKVHRGSAQPWESEEVKQLTPTSIMGGVPTVIAGGFMLLAGFVVAFWRPKSPSTPLAMFAVSGSRPTLADTKLQFLKLCDLSIPNMYSIPLQELLAQHHLLRFNSRYQYDEVFALGIFTVVNQLLEGLSEADSERIETAYFSALGDDYARFKADSAALEQWAASAGKALNLSGSDEVTEKLKAVAARAATGDFQYSKFFSIGLFQLLQQSGQTDPESFTTLVASMNLDKERVAKDLKVYKDLLKRLEMAKDMKEKFLERERKKQEERLAQKKAAEV